VVKLPQSWIVGIYAFFVTAPTDAFGGAWGVKYLVDAHHLTRDEASVAAVTMTFIGMAVGSPLLGWISQKLDNRKLTMFVSALIAAFALTVIVYGPQMTPLSACFWFFLFGASGTYVIAFVMTRRFTQSKYVATAVGFVNMISMFGSAFLTYIIGWLLDNVHTATGAELLYTHKDYQISLVALPVFYLISAFLLVPLIRDKKG
jgi:MFS family permease